MVSIDAEAAPLPLVWLFDQTGFDRVAMHVTKLFDPLCFCEDVEVVVAGLPYKLLGPGARETLLEYLEGSGEFCLLRLGDQEMDVVRHEDVAENLEAVFPASFFEDLLEGVAGGGVPRMLAWR